MNNNMQVVNMTALEAAVKALLGDNVAHTLNELYRVIDAAERRGYERGYQHSAGDQWDAGYQHGYSDGAAGVMPDADVPESDIREPIINAHVEGGAYPDMSELHVAEKISDDEFHSGINDHYLAMQART